MLRALALSYQRAKAHVVSLPRPGARVLPYAKRLQIDAYSAPRRLAVVATPSFLNRSFACSASLDRG